MSPALPPLDRVEMNRMLHAKVQRMALPGSLPGKKAPGLLTNLAPKLFDKTYDALTVDEMKKLYDYLDTLAVK